MGCGRLGLMAEWQTRKGRSRAANSASLLVDQRYIQSLEDSLASRIDAITGRFTLQ